MIRHSAVLLLGALFWAGCSGPNHTSVHFRHTGMTACMRVDSAIQSGAAGDWDVAFSAMQSARAMVRNERDRQVLALIEGYYRLGQMQREYSRRPEAANALSQLRVQMNECQANWLRPYLEYLGPVQPPAVNNACVRSPAPVTSWEMPAATKRPAPAQRYG